MTESAATFDRSSRSAKQLFTLSLVAHGILLACALRHRFFWGGDMAPYLHLAETAGLVAFAVVGGLAYVRALRRAPELPAQTWLRFGLLLTALATLSPHFLSNDLWDYLARGRVAVLGHDPYLTTVAALRSDPAMSEFAARANWPGWVMPYGPVAAVLQWLCAVPDSPWLGAYLWKGLAAAAHVATALSLAATTRSLSNEANARRMLVLWLWNPWLLLESAGSGHNDAFVALGLAACGHAIAQARFAVGSLAYGVAMLVKHGSPTLAPLLLAAAFRQRRLVPFAIGTGLVATILAVAWLLSWSAPSGLDWITDQANVAQGSLSSLLAAHVGSGAGVAATWIGTGLLVALLVHGAIALRDARSFGRHGALATIVLVLFCVPNFAPWYHLWWLPLVAVADARARDRALVVLAFTGPVSYAVFTATHAFGQAHEAWAWAAAALPPAAIVLGSARELLSNRCGPSDSAATPAPS